MKNMIRLFLLCLGLQTPLAFAAITITPNDIAITHYSFGGDACDSTKSFGWSEERYGKYWKNFEIKVSNIDPQKLYNIEVYSESFEDGTKSLLLDRTFGKNLNRKSETFSVSKKFFHLPANEKMDKFNLQVKISEQGSSSSSSSSDLNSISKSKTFLRFADRTAVIWPMLYEGDQSCYLTTEATPVSGIISNYNSERLKEVEFSSTDDEAQNSSGGNGRGPIFSLPCASIGGACAGFTDHVDTISRSRHNDNTHFELSFAVGINMERVTNFTNLSVNKHGMGFEWKLRTGEAGMIFKQYLLRKGDLLIYELDGCGLPSFKSKVTNAYLTYWAYDFVLLEEEKLADNNYLRSILQEKMPLINTCK
ncbi:MAG: hypothetical protein HQK50_09000 [Oligoflexia bacterium]|nr:hypothetical protein [Oligoflexia bacterium]